VKGLFGIALGLATGFFTGALARPAAVDASTGAVAQANSALQAGEADRAMALIQSLPQNGLYNAQAQNVACRVQFTLGEWDAAIRACQQAIRLDPRNSANHMWLGRAYGEKASSVSFLTAFSLGKKVLSEFQTAAQLDPRNGEALSDLASSISRHPASSAAERRKRRALPRSWIVSIPSVRPICVPRWRATTEITGQPRAI